MNAETTAKCAYFFDRLKKSGIEKAYLSFNGSGDDGQMEIEGFKYTNDPEEDQFEILNESTPFDVSLEELMCEIADGVLEVYDVDYCNGDGNSGGIEFDIQTGEIKTRYKVFEDKTDSMFI